MIHKLFFAWFALFFLRFGGDSSSSSSNSTSTTNVDKRQVVDGQGLGVSSDSSTVNVTQTDGGSVKNALDFAKEFGNSGLNFASSSLDSVVGLMLETIKSQAETGRAALTFANSANDKAMNFAFDAGKPDASLAQNYGKYLTIAAGLAALVYLWKGK